MITSWYIPAWNGDFRLEPDPDEPETHTLLTIEKPTADERRLLGQLQKTFAEKFGLGWESDDSRKMREPSRFFKTHVRIPASITDIGPVVASLCKPGPNVLTAVKFKDGRIEVCETSVSGAKKPEPYRSPSDPPKKEDDSKPSEESKALAKKDDATAAATVKRPTPCCPDCFTDEIALNKPATEVLLAFMDREQHESWKKHRFVIARGGITGHRYLVAHRNSPIAQKNTRMCHDLDDRATMHFHDHTVPPEEEVLAAMLILRYRESWLRNEATALYGRHRYVFKNPFGDGGDGVRDSMLTAAIGVALLDLLGDRRSRLPLGTIAYNSSSGLLVNELSPYVWQVPVPLGIT
jgi:hypothetical protein